MTACACGESHFVKRERRSSLRDYQQQHFLRMTKEQLLPDELRIMLPVLGAGAEERDPVMRVKFFYPDFEWTWYAIEFDGKDIFYGLVNGVEPEFGAFSLSELLESRGTLGCEIERDLSFTPKRVSELFPEIYKPR